MENSTRRWTRGEFFGLAAGVGVAAGAYGGWRLLGTAAGGSPSDASHFVSRPDLWPPRLTVVKRATEVAPGLLFLAPSSGPGQRGVMIADDRGELVWFRSTHGHPAMNLRVARFRGEPVLTWWEAQPGGGLGNGHHVIVDAGYREVARFPAANGRPSDLHEFLMTPEGTALVASYEIRDANLARFGGRTAGRVMGGVVQEVEVPSARLVHEWRSLDHVALDESHARVGNAWDYFHLNAIDVDFDGNLLISARNTWTVYKVHRRTGEVIWRLGGKRSDFALGPGARFAWQHDARGHEGGTVLSLFDNGTSPMVEPQSRGLVLSLDHARMRATVLRQYPHRPPVSARALGNVQLLPNGDVLVGYGVEPYFTEYSKDGAVRLDVSLPRGGENYRALRFPWAGRPVERPAARLGPDRRLYVSWNGATEVDRWQLQAGSTAESLRPVLTVPRQGFETPLTLPPRVSHAGAVALDAGGRPLARTSVVGVV